MKSSTAGITIHSGKHTQRELPERNQAAKGSNFGGGRTPWAS